MAARGAEEKQQITEKILSTFEGSFLNDKEIRIPINGLEIKCVLTCAKENIGGGGGFEISETGIPTSTLQSNQISEPTQEELDTVQNLMNALGL